MPVIILEYQDGTLVESKQGSGSIRCEVDKTTKKIRMILPQGTGLVERRTAMRLADTVARSGYLLSTGERIGQGFELVVDEKGTSIPDRLKQSPRVSYSSVTVGSVVDKK
jgi:hypothetical protein